MEIPAGRVGYDTHAASAPLDPNSDSSSSGGGGNLYPQIPKGETTPRPNMRPISGGAGYQGGQIGSGYPGLSQGGGYPQQGGGYPQQGGGYPQQGGGYPQNGYAGYPQGGYNQGLLFFFKWLDLSHGPPGHLCRYPSKVILKLSSLDCDFVSSRCYLTFTV